jgi:PAS domain S-box-containing protein
MIMPEVLSTIRLLELSRRGMLQEMSRLMRLVTEHCTEVIATHSVDLELKFLSVNGACDTVFHTFPQTLVGQSFYSVVHEDDRERVRCAFDEAVRRALSSGDREATVVTIDYRTPELPGEATTWVESSASVAFEDTHPIIIIISRNITWRKELEARRREDEEVARNESVVNAKLHYITCTAHDLKTYAFPPLFIVVPSLETWHSFLC